MRTFVFTVPETLARPPLGLDFAAGEAPPSPGAGERSLALLEQLYDSALEPQTRQLHTAPGGVGVVLEKSPFCHYVERDGVVAVFAGEVSYWPGHDTLAEAHDAFVRGEEPVVQDDASWLLDFYASFSMHANAADLTEAALSALSRVFGAFAFVVYDTATQRVWAARDAAGTQPMYWGTTADGQLVFGTNAAHLDCCCDPSATPFPAGSLYANSGHMFAVNPGEEGWVIYSEEKAGNLLSFVESRSPSAGHHWRDIKAIPRIKSNGVLCGAVYRVASEQQFGGIQGC